MSYKKKKKPYLYRLMKKIKMTFRRWARRNPLKARRFYIVTSAVVVVIAVTIVVSITGKIEDNSNKLSDKENQQVTARPVVKATLSPDSDLKDENVRKPASTKVPITETVVDTKTIYSYLQGPRSWKQKRVWSGYWGNAYMNGSKFGAFGCGLCCMANVYSSITPSYYKASPVDMYGFAKKNTRYWGGSAIDWPYMVKGMRKAGIHCGVKTKPSRYSSFKKDIAASKCAIVLVSSYDSSCYWKHTPGHYVTVFAYDKKNDRVFLADSGEPAHNRHWVSLKKIYRSLKKSSRYQYICVTDYNRSEDTFRSRKASGKWVRPSYMKTSQKSVKRK